MNQLAMRRWEAPSVAQSWRLAFAGAPPEEGAEAIFVREPSDVVVTLAERRPEDTFAPPSAEDGGFTLIWAPPGVGAPTIIERDAENWMRDAQPETAGDPVRASVRTVRVIWASDRAVVFSAATERKCAIDAIARFTIAHREVSRLEAEIRALWGPLQEDVGLTHSVEARDQRRQRSANVRTETAAKMKMAWLRLSTSLEQFDPTLSDLSKRIFAELIAAAMLYDRLEIAEDSIDFALEQYEVVNTRLIEAKIARQERMNALTGYLFEAAIIVLLGYEILHH